MDVVQAISKKESHPRLALVFKMMADQGIKPPYTANLLVNGKRQAVRYNAEEIAQVLTELAPSPPQPPNSPKL